MPQVPTDDRADRQPAASRFSGRRLSGRRLVPIVVALLVLGIAVLLPTAFRFRQLELESERLSQYWPPVAELLTERYLRLGERWDSTAGLAPDRLAQWQAVQRTWSLGAIDLRRQQPLAVQLERLAAELAAEATDRPAETRGPQPDNDSATQIRGRQAIEASPAWIEFDLAATKLRAATQDPLGRLTAGMLGLRYPVDLQLTDL